MSQVVDYFGPMLGRRRSCWADVGPLAAMFSRLLGTFAWRIIMVVLHIAFCALCTHISMFVFICSLTIILCVLKTIQPTPLVVKPGRYSNHLLNNSIIWWINVECVYLSNREWNILYYLLNNYNWYQILTLSVNIKWYIILGTLS